MQTISFHYKNHSIMIYRCLIAELSFLIDDDMFRQRCQPLSKPKKTLVTS